MRTCSGKTRDAYTVAALIALSHATRDIRFEIFSIEKLATAFPVYVKLLTKE
jgi:hypothetical protein